MTAYRAEVTLPDFPLDGRIKTLGFGIVAWIEDMLRQPDGDEAGGPFRLTREQLNFVLWFYAVDERGRFRYRRAVLRRSKGWGKSPFLGGLCLAELCGPVRFGGWDAHGEPVGIPHPMPWVNLAGVSETQTQNTMTVVLAMLENAPAVDEYGLDVGLTRVFTPGGGRLLPITASSSTQEGARPSFAVMDETHHWTESNGGWKLARVIRRNLAKSRDGSARSIETTNAHEPGQESVAESSYQDFLAIQEGRAKAAGLLYDSRSAPLQIDLADEDELLRGLALAYGDATWVDLERIREEVYDPSTPPEEARRFYLNQIVAAADSWVSPAEWGANENPDLAPLADKETITLGFDGGRTDDSSALVACRVSDGAPFLLGLWEKPNGPAGVGWEVDQSQVRDMVDHAFARYDVVAFFSDVAYWETDVDAWRDEYGERLLVKATTRHAVAWDMRSHQADTVRAVEALNRAIVDHECPHNGDARLTRHVLNARRRPNRWGVSFGKETRESPKKVDALAAFILARMARSRV
ncbi:MAG: terminase, partial [Microbispora sp.]|nr:terminase [Microbispora sp.]